MNDKQLTPEENKSILEKLNVHLQKDCDLGFLKQNDVDRIIWYVNTYFIPEETQQTAALQARVAELERQNDELKLPIEVNSMSVSGLDLIANEIDYLTKKNNGK